MLVSVGVSVFVSVGVGLGHGVGVTVSVGDGVGVGVGVGVTVLVGDVVGVTVGVSCSNGTHELSIFSMNGSCFGTRMVPVPSAYWLMRPLSPAKTFGSNGVSHGSPNEPVLLVSPRNIT